MHPPNNTLVGTIGGTFLSIAATISYDDIFKTVILAASGATISFIVSLLLKSIFRNRKKNV